MASPQPRAEGEKGNGKHYMCWKVSMVLCINLSLKLLRAWGALQALVTPHERLTTSPVVLCLGTTGVVNDQHDIDAIGLQQVHEKAPVSLGVQSHASGMLGCESFVLTGGHLQ